MSEFVREEKLFLAIGGVDDRLVAESAEPRKSPGKPVWVRWAAMAAAFVVVAGAGLYAFLPRLGGNAGGDGISGGDMAAPGGVSFMSYAGPVLPLTVLDGPDGLSATREVTWKFLLEDDARYLDRAEVTDAAAIRNGGAEELTVTVGYPVVAGLDSDAALLPALTVDGEPLETALLWGAAGDTGGDYPVWEPRISGWEDCKALLEDGSYLEDAREAAPALDYTVTVWEFTDSAAPEVRDAAPTLAVTFQIDEEKTRVYSWGFNGYSGWEDGTRQYSYFVPRQEERDGRRLLIFLGEVPEEYTMAGYQDGGCDKPLEGVTAKMTAFTATLGEVLDRLAEEYQGSYGFLEDRLEDFKAAARKLMARLLSVAEERRDYFSMEDLLSHALVSDRVVWACGEVVIPPGGEVTVVARYQKEPSFDYVCANTGRRGLRGWDLGTSLGSSLTFEKVVARLENAARLVLEGQNFGFDLRGGVTQVELDPAEEYYYMEVRVRGE